MQALFAGAAIAVLVRYKRRDCFTLATASFLILPYAHNYDMTVVSLGFAVLLYCQWEALSLFERGVGALGFLSPALTFLIGWAVPPILLIGLLIQARSHPGTESAL